MRKQVMMQRCQCMPRMHSPSPLDMPGIVALSCLETPGQTHNTMAHLKNGQVLDDPQQMATPL